MKGFVQTLGFVLLASAASATELDETFDNDPRIFFVNFTSSLVQVNATILAWGLLVLGVLAAAAIALYYLYVESQSSSGGYGYGYQSQGYNYQYARSNDEGYDFNGFNVLSWISLMQELYEKFDVNDLECQKKLICEVMREPEYYGSMAMKFKAGFRFARYFENIGLPEDLRELLDEYMDANDRADNNKDCEEYYPCQFSVRDSFKRTFTGNHVQ